VSIGVAIAGRDPYKVGRRHDTSLSGDLQATGHGEGGPASKRIVVAYGFWIFLLSDIVMFSALFAAYTVLANAIGDGPSGRDLFKMPIVAVETACLLASSFACGLASVAAQGRHHLWTQLGLLVAGLLGAVFVVLELRDFVQMIAQGAGPSRSAFLSSFFALVGCHGIHVTAGLLWLGTMMAQIFVKGFQPHIMRRLMCFTLFWHALDIVWVALFSIVFLMGVYG